MFPTLQSTGVGHFGAKFGEEGVTDISHNMMWERHEAVVCKEIVSISFAA